MTSQAKEKYTAEFKENAVKRANESGECGGNCPRVGSKAKYPV
jgi:transposase-like protein